MYYLDIPGKFRRPFRRRNAEKSLPPLCSWSVLHPIPVTCKRPNTVLRIAGKNTVHCELRHILHAELGQITQPAGKSDCENIQHHFRKLTTKTEGLAGFVWTFVGFHGTLYNRNYCHQNKGQGLQSLAELGRATAR